MKNSKTLWLIVSAAVVALAAIVLLVMGIARGDKPATDTGTTVDTTVKDTSAITDNSTTAIAVTTTTTTIKAEKLTEKQKKALVASLDTALTVPESDTVNDPAFLTDMEQKNGYEVLSAESRGKVVTASVRVFAPDLYTIAKQIDAQGGGKSEAELLEAIRQAISSASVVEKTVELEFEKNGDSYTPLITVEFFDAYYGGVFQLYDELLIKEG